MYDRTGFTLTLFLLPFNPKHTSNRKKIVLFTDSSNQSMAIGKYQAVLSHSNHQSTFFNAELKDSPQFLHMGKKVRRATMAVACPLKRKKTANV
jgi:hypothetical protein